MLCILGLSMYLYYYLCNSFFKSKELCKLPRRKSLTELKIILTQIFIFKFLHWVHLNFKLALNIAM